MAPSHRARTSACDHSRDRVRKLSHPQGGSSPPEHLVGWDTIHLDLVLSLHRAIHHDATRYEDPYRFMPERYEGDTSTVSTSCSIGSHAHQSGQSQQSAVSADVSKRDHFAFGAGRRICKLAFSDTLELLE